MRNTRRTCAHCTGAYGDDARLTIAVARRAGVPLLAGAEHLHAMCATLVVRATRTLGGGDA